MNTLDLPISRIDEARKLAQQMRPWRVRLRFEGPNPANKSGRSSKWWEASSPGGAGFTATCRWGVIGGKGQEQGAVDTFAALDRAIEKQRKGYSEEGTPGARRTAVPTRQLTSFDSMARAATWSSFDLSRLAILAGERGLVRLDLGATAEINGATVAPYLAADGALYGVGRVGDRYLVAVLRSAP